jgi:hypothetical protein
VTLIVVAAVDRRFQDNIDALRCGPHEVIRADTSRGGHPSAAFVRAYHQYPDEEAYLFTQDSCAPTAADVVAPFEFAQADVVGWARFPMFFDNDYQAEWVRNQGYTVQPLWGIFGPIFYATRDAMERTEMWFPRTPRNRLEAQGTERAWAFAFMQAGIKPMFLHEWSNQHLSSGEAYPFKKTFALRPDVAA